MKLFVVILLAVFCHRTNGDAVSLPLNLNAPIMAHVNMSSIKTYIDENFNERLPALIKKDVRQMVSSEVDRLTEHLTTTLQKKIGKNVDKTMQTKLNGFAEQLNLIEKKITDMVKSKISVMSKQLTERMYEVEQKMNETMKNDTQELSEDLQKSKNHCRGKCDTRKGFYEYVAIFTEPYYYSGTTPVLYIYGHDHGTLTIESNSFKSKRSIIKGKNEILLKQEAFLRDGIENKAIHITSKVPITVYGFQRYTGTCDGYAAIPLKYMSTKYIVASFAVWTNRPLSRSLIGVVSLGGITKVEVHLKMKQGTVKFNGQEFKNGEIIKVDLNAFQTLQLSNNYDLSGSVISSSKPIGVVSGNKCNSITHAYCNHFTEMILPVDQLDNEFIIPIIQTRPKSTVRLLSPGKVKINVQLKDRHYETHINEGEYHDLIHNDIAVVTSTGNLLVTVFPHEAKVFDSYMMTVYGINQYKSDYSFIIPSKFSSFISITFYGDAIRGFEIDGHKMKAEKVFEKTVNGKKYITFSSSIAEGAHIITNTNGIRFGLWLYGNSFYDGYGYPAGIAFRNKGD
ncbi:IgGFc-binding protein-like [Mytilus edulis]|uniref:IgGFc-binding protein-like n=1 Tax=Mytilus edulis TaxID=6550 RepID=UPI0039EE2E6C